MRIDIERVLSCLLDHVRVQAHPVSINLTSFNRVALSPLSTTCEPQHLGMAQELLDERMLVSMCIAGLPFNAYERYLFASDC